MKIAICEDKQNERDALGDMLKAEIDRRRIAGEVVLFSSGEAMLKAMRGETFPVNFLDIYMDKITGVEVASEIRSRDKEAAIVFTTSSRDHMTEGFDLGAVHYLLKPYTREAVEAALDRCLRVAGAAERFVELTANRENRKVFLAKIGWIESQDKSCVLRLPNESLRVYTRLDELLSLISDSRFLRCHRSFAVNLDHAAYVKGNDFVMKDGSLVPIRREGRARIKELFEDYCFEKQRRGY
ncbi:MAG: LytTR family DNA-binding domain-containing protein [Clostridiales bacterium]|nr:LytTR family DNA-binding domain-containing protein [Clostridiales bacterium]